jgi:hypothetical protein
MLGLSTLVWIYHHISLSDLLILPQKHKHLLPNTHSSHSAEPKPVHICQHTKSEIDHINHRREILLQNFPEDQPKESFPNPIVIEDNNDKNISSLQRSEEAQRELVLRFATYCGYNQ